MVSKEEIKYVRDVSKYKHIPDTDMQTASIILSRMSESELVRLPQYTKTKFGIRDSWNGR